MQDLQGELRWKEKKGQVEREREAPRPAYICEYWNSWNSAISFTRYAGRRGCSEAVRFAPLRKEQDILCGGSSGTSPLLLLGEE